MVSNSKHKALNMFYLKSNWGIWRYNGKDYKKFDTTDGLGNYSVWSILEDKASFIWVGTGNTGGIVARERSLPTSRIYDTFNDTSIFTL